MCQYITIKDVEYGGQGYETWICICGQKFNVPKGTPEKNVYDEHNKIIDIDHDFARSLQGSR